MSARTTQLRNTVQTIHRCKAEHVKSAPVIEMFWQKVAWDGVVEVFRFRLAGQSESKTALRVELYAASSMGDGSPIRCRRKGQRLVVDSDANSSRRVRAKETLRR